MEAIDYVSGNDEEDTSPLRSILVDEFCKERFDTTETKDSLTRFPKDFLIDVMFGHAHLFNLTDDSMPLVTVDVHDYHNCDIKTVGDKRKACKSRISERSRVWC